MIKKISKLRNFGLYNEFNWNSDLDEFRKFNLIYGWNRSGKTTISRVFSSCEKKITYDKNINENYPKGGAFTIKTSNDELINEKNVLNSNVQIRVFNQDFIDEHLSYKPIKSCNPIIYLSKEDIEVAQKLDELKNIQKKLVEETRPQIEKSYTLQKSRNNDIFTALGREISSTLFQRNYDRRNVETRISEFGLENFSKFILSDEEFEEKKQQNKVDQLNKIEKTNEFELKLNIDKNEINNINDYYEFIQEILKKEIVTESIQRFESDSELNKWASEGYEIHVNRNENQTCLFCENKLSDDFINKLANHFNEVYKNFIENLDLILNELEDYSIQLLLENNNDISVNLKESYETSVKRINNDINELNQSFLLSRDKLLEKKGSPFETDFILESPQLILEKYIDSLSNLNQIIDEHNNNVINHDDILKENKKNIELHLIGNGIKEYNYIEKQKEFDKISAQKEELDNSIENNDIKIIELKSKTSNIGGAIKNINKYLEGIFGRKEIQLKINDNGNGYSILNNNEPANCLSEGEKTAIAFAYFIAKIDESEFDKAKGIIFIDDPISSLDTNYIYYCYSLLINYFNDCYQIFISTHNFQFFNLIKNWFSNKDKNGDANYYMIENFIENGKRQARIIELDGTLKKFKSEYHFLFTILFKASTDQDKLVQYEDLYTISNIIRRFFEIFADFKVPTTGDLRSKLKKIVIDINSKEENIYRQIDNIKEEKAYRLINDYSHNFDPRSIIEHKNRDEIKEVIRIILDIVQKSDPMHYRSLMKVCINQPT